MNITTQRRAVAYVPMCSALGLNGVSNIKHQSTASAL